MPLDNPFSGPGNTSEYQSSALPWVTSALSPAAGSPVAHHFPKVTRFINVSNLGNGTMSVAFSRSGILSTSNKYILSASQVLALEVRVKSLWLQGESGTPNYSLVAGLTTINAKDVPILTGTLADGSAGWQGV